MPLVLNKLERTSPACKAVTIPILGLNNSVQNNFLGLYSQ